MSQHDQVLDNQAGAAFRADLNNLIAAIYSKNSGATEPSVKSAYMDWIDTSIGHWKVRNAANNAWIDLGPVASALLRNHGQCQLSKVSSNLVLLPRNGDKLIVAGTTCTIPAAGVTLAASGLSAGTTYNIYATQSGGAINALEASATAHSMSTTAGNIGNEIKTGDEDRTLVGMARVVTGPAWSDTASKRFVRSWFNDKGIAGHVAGSGNYGIASSPWIEVSSTIRAEFLLWASEVFVGTATACWDDPGAAGAFGYTGYGIDSATPAAVVAGLVTMPVANALITGVAHGTDNTLAEGYHYMTLLGGISGGSTPTVTSTSGQSGVSYHTSGNGN